MHPSGERRRSGHVLALAVVFGVSVSSAVPALGIETLSSFPVATGAASGEIVLAQSSTPVTFSAEQSDRGKRTFERQCTECHGDDLKGGMNGGPPLRGNAFEQKFGNGAPASALFLFMSTAMPPNSPGRFSAKTYAELMAYVLDRNGFHEGAPLPSDVDALNNLTMEK
jgi:mono/diheme cytochrome c family protein